MGALAAPLWRLSRIAAGVHSAGRSPTDPNGGPKGDGPAGGARGGGGGGAGGRTAPRNGGEAGARAAYKVGPLRATHRDAVEEIVRATGVFHEREVSIAVELFDETYGAPASAKATKSSPGRGTRRVRSGAPVVRNIDGQSDYEFLGLFDRRNHLVGYACFGPTPGTDRGYDLYWIAVNPTVQGEGGGTFLISEVERQLGDRNARFVLAETSSRAEYAGTRAFYVARGYAEAARVREFYGPADDLVLFTKRLQPAPRSRVSAAVGGGPIR